MSTHLRALVLGLGVFCLTAGGAVAQSRDTRTSVNDSWITTKIAASYFMDNDIKARNIEVHTVNGIVTLTGTVHSARERQQAVSIARTVDGVKDVVDTLTLQPDGAVGTTGASRGVTGQIGDAWITTKVQAKFFLDPLVKARRVDVSTRDGVVTLSGTVNSEAERQQARSLAVATDGVVRVDDQLELQTGAKPAGAETPAPKESQPAPGVDEISRLAETDPVILAQIKSRLALDSQVSALAIDVDVDGGVVTLKGEVNDQAARERALSIAREVKGVKRVKDELRIKGGA